MNAQQRRRIYFRIGSVTLFVLMFLFIAGMGWAIFKTIEALNESPAARPSEWSNRR